MALWLRQLGALLWKDFKIQYRSPFWTAFELLPPILLSLLLAYLRSFMLVRWSDPPVDKFTFPEQSAPNLCVANPWRGGGSHESPALLRVLYAPDGTDPMKEVGKALHVKLAEYVRYDERYSSVNITVKGFATEAELVKYARKSIETTLNNCTLEYGGCYLEIVGGLVFAGDVPARGLDAADIDYTIRMPSVRGLAQCWGGFAGWFTDEPAHANSLGYGTGHYATHNPYHSLGITLMQSAAAHVFVERRQAASGLNVSDKLAAVTLTGTPAPGSWDGMFSSFFDLFFPIFLVLVLAVPAVYTARHVTAEKESSLKEYMKVMGLSSWLFWLSHFISAYAKTLFIMFFITLVLCYVNFDPSEPGSFAVFAHSDPTVVLLYFALFGAAVVWFTFAVAALAQTGRRAGKMTLFVWMGIFVPYIVLSTAGPSGGAKLAWSLLMNTGFGFAMQLISARETSGVGVRWSTLGSGASLSDSYSLGGAMLMLCVDIVIYVVIVWYVDAVYPGQGAVARPLWFPFQPSYWREMCGCCCGGRCGPMGGEHSDSMQRLTHTPNVANNGGAGASASDRFQPYDTGTPIAVRLHALTKRFGKQVAVNKITLDMASNQCFAVLGPNGAGKSTTMAMLSGMLTPSGGSATVLGFDIGTQLAHIRQMVGLCPQHNVLFDRLTVEEHLRFFCMLKGVSIDRGEMDGLLSEVGLLDDVGKARRGALASALSGGQMRKLSVCIALVGRPQLVILDEPTAGIDVASRQRIWKLLLKQRKERTMLLTTHYMDEADVLGDRIAIIAKGRLRTAGQPMFLKRKFGAGYLLTAAFAPGAAAPALADELLAIIRQHVPHAQTDRTAGQEATFLLPDDHVDRFADMLEALENRQKELSVDTFGVARCSLEDVFLRVAEEAELEEMEEATSGSVRHKRQSGAANVAMVPDNADGVEAQRAKQRPLRRAATVDPAEFTVDQPLSGVKLALHQYWAMVCKRFDHWRRSWWSYMIYLALGWCFMLLIFSVDRLVPDQEFSATTARLGMKSVLTSLDRADSEYLVYYSPAFEAFKDGYTSVGLPAGHVKASAVDAADDPVPLMVKHVRGEYAKNRPDSAGSLIDNQTIADRFTAGGALNDELYMFHNGKLMHALPAAFAAMHQAAMRVLDPTVSIKVAAQPLPVVDRGDSRSQVTISMINEVMGPAAVACVFAIALAIVAAFFPSFIAKERRSGMKHLQLASGASPLSFWLGHLSFDTVLFMLFPIGCVLFALICGRTGFNWPVFLLCQLLFALAVLPTMYFIPFCIKSPTKCTVVALISHIAFGIIPYMVYYLTLPLRYMPQMRNEGEDGGFNPIKFSEDWELAFSIISPTFNGVKSLSDIYLRGTIDCTSVDCSKPSSISMASMFCCADAFKSGVFGWLSPGLSRTMVILLCQAVGWFVLLLLIDYDLLRPVRVALATAWSNAFGKKAPVVQQVERGRAATLSAQTRNMVKTEESLARRVVNGEWDEDKGNDDGNGNGSESPPRPSVAAHALVKTYGTRRAVDNVSFTVRRAECFGLLGENGAGKTSTFRMITGEALVEGGEAVIGHRPVRTAWRQANSGAGYCPQFDATMGSFTGGAVLRLFARIRGIPRNDVSELSETVMRAVGLDGDMDKSVKSYSGGMRRRLSLAVSLVASPPVLLLDEPTAGVDPEVRRRLWRIVSSVCAGERGTSVLLTSHNMAECDALCNRLAIMSNGRLLAVGSPQLLKSSYGDGCSLHVKLSAGGDDTDAQHVQQRANDVFALKADIEHTFPGALFKDEHENLLSVTIPSAGDDGAALRWSELFGRVQRVARSNAAVVDDYTLSQASLEQMFIAFCNRPAVAPQGPSVDVSMESM